MQTTLLGLGIAIILALVAALVGPHFVDWSQHRPLFEASVSRIIGLPVRVQGAIDMRILPTPSLVLRDIEAGDAGEPRLKAREVAVELALGPLMRGELRAVEIRLLKPELGLALDRAGQVDWPGALPKIDADSLSIERLAIEDGRAVLSDRASASKLVLDKVWFNGDLRSLAGPFKGEGGFSAEGERYGYRLSSGRIGEDGLKLRLSVEPADKPLTVEADGMLQFERGAPRFEGALTLARPASVALSRGRAVATDTWRATSKIKLSPTGVLIDQIDVQYGADERAVKLTGTAQVQFGKDARVDGVVSARQIDLDRIFVLPEATRRLPLAVLRSAAEAFGGALRPPIPVRLGLGIDSLTLAGAVVQTVRGDIFTDGESWNLETLEFRAPGMTQVRASGRIAFAADGATFTGPAVVESSDPKVLLAWVEGRSETWLSQAGPLRASGDLTLGPEKFAIDRLKAEVDRKTIGGRLAYAWAADTRPARLGAELTASELDVDQTIAFAKAVFPGTKLDMPGEVALAIDIGVATVAGVEAKGAMAKLKYDANGLVLERVAVGDLGGASLELNGRIEALTTAPQGAVTLDLDARGLDGIMAVVAKYAPHVADAARSTAARLAPAKLSALLTVGRAESGGDRAELTVSGRAGVARVNLRGEAIGEVANYRAAEGNLSGRMFADDGVALVALLGLDKAVAVDKRAGSLSLTASGRLGDLSVETRLAAGRLEASAKGTLRLLGDDGVAGALDLRLAAADAVLLRTAGATAPIPITVKNRLTLKGGTLLFEEVSAVVAGNGVRGRLGVTLGQPVRIEGRLQTDAIEVPALISAAAGMPARPAGSPQTGTWATEPFAKGVLADLVGKIEFEATRAALSPTLIGQKIRGLVRFGDGEVSFEDIEGSVGGGRLLGQLVLQAGPEGLSARGRLALTDAEAGAVMPGEARPPVTGRLALQIEAEGLGLSPATLIGSLGGAGTVTLEGAQIAGLDPKAFDSVTRAVDRGLLVDSAKIRDMMETALQAGRITIPRVDGAFTVTAGQARWGNVATRGEGADLSITGAVDFAEWLIDARLMLSGQTGAPAPASGRPDVFIALKGPLATPKRTLDVSALTGWLMLRSVDRQSKQIEVLEAERQQTPTVGSTPPATAPAPPVETVQPAPAVVRTAPADETAEPQARPRPPTPAPAAAPTPPRRAAAPPESAPTLPPPIEIRPLPGPRTGPGTIQRSIQPSNGEGTPKPRPGAATQPPGDIPPPAPRRSLLDQLFGPQR